jgi:hypothetical protein
MKGRAMIGKTEGLYGCKVDKSIVIMVDGKRWNALKGGGRES